jgi:hypothetical protein
MLLDSDSAWKAMLQGIAEFKKRTDAVEIFRSLARERQKPPGKQRQEAARERRQESPDPRGLGSPREFFSIAELARRWRCSRGTVYNRLRAVGAKILDFTPRGKRGRKAIAVAVVLEIENRQSKRLR